MTGDFFTQKFTAPVVFADRVQVRVRHADDDAGTPYLLGWFKLADIDGVLELLKRYPIYLGDGEFDVDDPNDVTVQAVGENGVMCIEFVFASEADDDE